jgi:hypothetical protein
LSPISKEDWESSNNKPVALEWRSQRPNDLLDFVEKAKRECGLDEVLIADGNDETYRTAFGDIGVF